MGRVLWLADVLRGAGLPVHEVPGWQDRRAGIRFEPRALVCHATAGSRNASDQQEINTLLKGSSTAPAPIAQLYLSRTGMWHVVAAGRCNHIGDAPLPGTGKAGNRYALGVEAANDNRGEPWPDVQYWSYVRGVAAICRRMGWSSARVFGHKEISSSGKTDPTFSMPTFRANVDLYIRTPTPAPRGPFMALTDDQQQQMYDAIMATSAGVVADSGAPVAPRWWQRILLGKDPHNGEQFYGLAQTQADLAEVKERLARIEQHIGTSAPTGDPS